MQGEALLDRKERPLWLEKGVPLILEYDYLYSCFALLCKLIAVFTPLSIRRGVGGEAVDGRGWGCRWAVDYLKFVGQDKYLFVSRVPSLLQRKPTPCLTRPQYVEQIKHGNGVKNCIEFVSLQDLKGSIYFGGSHKKLEEVAELTWDLLVIDEAHEGVDTTGCRTGDAHSSTNTL